MNKSFWPLAINTWGDEERAAAHRVIDSGNLTMGEEVAAFEREFAAYVGSKHVVMVNSGSSANLLAVAAVQRGFRFKSYREWIVPAIAWATTYAPLDQHGFSLKVVDVNYRTLNATWEAYTAAISHETVGIVGVSILGNPAPVDRLRKLADDRHLFFIEDNCESLGARIGLKHCGTFGHIGTFSTFFSHHISTGEGGVLVTDDDKLFDLAVCMRAHGWTRDLSVLSSLIPSQGKEKQGGYQFVLPGYNLRPTEIAAAVGRVQLRRLDEMNHIRLRNWETFRELFGQSEPRWRIQWPQSVRSYAVPFGFTLVFEDEQELRRAQLLLMQEGIEYRMVTGGCFADHPAAAHYVWSAPEVLVNARHVHRCGLFVGNHPVDLLTQIERMAEVLK